MTFREPVPTAATAVVTAPGPAAEPLGAPEPAVEVEAQHHVSDGRETHTGRIRRIRAARPSVEDLLPAQPSHASSFRRRYGVPYDTQGPKIRLGVLWGLAVVGSVAPQALRPWGLAVLFGVVAGAAAAQVVDAHRGDRASIDRALAAFGGSAIAVSATLGSRPLGVGFILLVLVSLATTVATPERGRLPIPRAGRIVGAAGICGGAAASLVLLAEYEIGALVILFLFVAVYDASDFVVGSGASNGIEGPLAGMIFIGAIAAIAALLKAPPFNDNGADIWSFAVLAMIACPAGQIVASALLPQANAHAPALRRMDSLLVVAPAWAGLIGLYLAHAS